MERPRRACTSRKRPSHDVTDDGNGRSDCDASWEVDPADASGSSASVNDSSPSDTSGSRTSGDRSAGGDYSVTCPELAKTEFESWESFHAYLDLYRKETFQARVLRTRSTKSVVERNKQIKNVQNSSSEHIPDEWKCDQWGALHRSTQASKW
ncbi:hypothetical protein GQ600_24780 [Phytophthora cactorum]|nr:hypothetical protein GQ600_24780 [Phytophthora cactorum]